VINHANALFHPPDNGHDRVGLQLWIANNFADARNAHAIARWLLAKRSHASH
jgi:hypothetical protein